MKITKIYLQHDPHTNKLVNLLLLVFGVVLHWFTSRIPGLSWALTGSWPTVVVPMSSVVLVCLTQEFLTGIRINMMVVINPYQELIGEYDLKLSCK